MARDTVLQYKKQQKQLKNGPLQMLFNGPKIKGFKISLKYSNPKKLMEKLCFK
jgi:hypothetical protein